MFALFRFGLARLGLASALAVAATLMVADTRPADAYSLKGGHTPGEIAGACFKAGGTFTSGSAGSYSCQTANGEVRCDKDGYCNGSCEKCPKVVKGGLNDVLRPPASADTISATGSSAPAHNKKPIDNVRRLKLTSGGHANQTIAPRRTGIHFGAQH